MKKIKVSADTVLTILKGVMNDEEINTTITDTTAPSEWQGKSVQEALNVEYYTFKHRPVDTEKLVGELIGQGGSYDTLHALSRAFCILSISNTERVFSKDNDIVTVSANLEYWIQTDKVKLLEDMFEDITVETTGIRIPVKIGEEDRQVLLAVGKPTVSDIQEATEFGEMSVVDCDVDLVFYPNAISKSDYKIEFFVDNEWITLPYSNFSFSCDMTQKAIPSMNNPHNVGNINLSRIKSFVLAFDGYKNRVVNVLANFSFSNGEEANFDNNKSFQIKLTRDYKEYIYNCVIKNHTITVQEDTGNETHSLTLTTRGIE